MTTPIVERRFWESSSPALPCPTFVAAKMATPIKRFRSPWSTISFYCPRMGPACVRGWRGWRWGRRSFTWTRMTTTRGCMGLRRSRTRRRQSIHLHNRRIIGVVECAFPSVITAKWARLCCGHKKRRLTREWRPCAGRKIILCFTSWPVAVPRTIRGRRATSPIDWVRIRSHCRFWMRKRLSK